MRWKTAAGAVVTFLVPFVMPFAIPFMAATVAMEPAARAAAPFVYRDQVLPSGDVALDLGLGIGHAPAPPGPDQNGLGMNLEISAGVSREAEIGFRTGLRLDRAGQYTQADGYGRPFDTETYGTAGDRVANPELYGRWRLARGPNAQLAAELRAYLPIETGSRFGMMVALPIALQGGVVRLDTGVYIPVLFYDPTLTVISIPAHLWFQVSPTLWLGPLFGIRVFRRGSASATEYPFGFGIGSMLTHALDLRAWLLFPDINQDQPSRSYGGGFAFQIRFE
jgi:hypothetical protein